MSEAEKGSEVDPKPPVEECSLVTRLEALKRRKPSEKALRWFEICD